MEGVTGQGWIEDYLKGIDGDEYLGRDEYPGGDERKI